MSWQAKRLEQVSYGCTGHSLHVVPLVTHYETVIMCAALLHRLVEG